MEQYTVTGMSCAACSARVEKAVMAVEGVQSCSVSLLTNAMGVEGTASPAEIIAAVQAAGYGAEPKNAQSAPQKSIVPADTETPQLLRRLITSGVFLLLLMYISMGHTMFGLPLPAFFADNPLGVGMLQMLVSGIVLVINQRFFISGGKALWNRSPNMDTLVAMGSGVSYMWSTCVLFAMTRHAEAHHLHELYFESAAMIPTLITVGKTLEARAKGKTTSALRGLMQLAPKTAVLIENGTEREIPAEQIRPGMHFAVYPGAQIPADGIVTEGNGAVDESALTGESIPVDKKPGDTVSAGTMNRSGYLRCEAQKTGSETALAQITRMVEEAAATKAPIAKLADRVSGVFVPAVISIAVVTAIIWLALGQSAAYALARGVSVLVISCPCALGLATPVAVMVGSGVGARHGILFKTAAALEETGRITAVALDKTGTVTEGKPRVTDILPAEGIPQKDFLQLAAAVEQHSEHPLARAVMGYAGQKNIPVPPVTGFQSMTGSGVQAEYAGETLTGGRLETVQPVCDIPESMAKQAETLAAEGKTPLWFARGRKLAGIIAVADIVRPDSAAAISDLRAMGLDVLMLTGDNPVTAGAVGKAAGVDRVIAGVRPDGKEQVIRETAGKVCMVGDGTNDAPALTRAAVGMAIGAGTDVAVDAADVVLMHSTLRDVVTALQLSRAVLKNIRQNLFWAFCYNVVGIPLAAGVLAPFGLTLHPMFGAAAMSLSSFCVVTNALRLNLFKPKLTPVDIPEKQENTKGTEPMKATLEIKGMMCGHCEAHVRKALEKMDGVTVLRVSHEDGIAEVESAAPVAEDAFRAVITDEGYELVAMH